MPDLATHVIAGKLCGRTARGNIITPLLVGTVLPDVIGRVPVFIGIVNSFKYVEPAHSLLPMMTTCLGLSLLFQKEWFKNFTFLYLGVLLHFFLDMLQIPYGRGYLWFWPFSDQSFHIGLLQSNHVIYWMPLWLAILLLDIFWIRPKKRNQKS